MLYVMIGILIAIISLKYGFTFYEVMRTYFKKNVHRK